MDHHDFAWLVAAASTGCTSVQDNVLTNGFQEFNPHSEAFAEIGTPHRITRFAGELKMRSSETMRRFNHLIHGQCGFNLEDYDPAKHAGKSLLLWRFIISFTIAAYGEAPQAAA